MVVSHYVSTNDLFTTTTTTNVVNTTNSFITINANEYLVLRSAWHLHTYTHKRNDITHTTRERRRTSTGGARISVTGAVQQVRNAAREEAR